MDFIAGKNIAKPSGQPGQSHLEIIRKKRGLGDCPQGFDFRNKVKNQSMETFLFKFKNKINTLRAIPHMR